MAFSPCNGIYFINYIETGGLKFIEIYCLLGFVLMAIVFAEYDILVKFDSNLLV